MRLPLDKYHPCRPQFDCFELLMLPAYIFHKPVDISWDNISHSKIGENRWKLQNVQDLLEERVNLAFLGDRYMAPPVRRILCLLFSPSIAEDDGVVVRKYLLPYNCHRVQCLILALLTLLPQPFSWIQTLLQMTLSRFEF